MGISILIILVGLLLAGVVILLYSMSANNMVELTDGAIPLEKVFPIQTIENDYIVNGNGDITAGFEILLPEVFTLHIEDQKQFIADLEGICKMLPFGTIIHQQINFYISEYKNNKVGEIQNYIHKENILHYNGRPTLENASYLYITFSDQGATKNIRNTQSSLLRKNNIPFSQPFKDIENRLNELESYMINFEEGLKGMQNVEVKRMVNVELNNKIYDFMNCSYDKPTIDATNKVVSPMHVSSQGDLKIGEYHVAVLSLVEEGALLYPFGRYPKITGSDTEIKMPKNIESKCSMTFPIGLGLPFAHTLNIVIEITDIDKTTTKLTSDGKGLNPIVQFYPPAAEKKRQLENFCNMITQENYQTTYTAVNVIIKDNNKECLQKKISQAKNGFQNMNHSNCFVENVETANLFFSNIPGNARSNYRGFINIMPQALSYFMKESIYLSDAEGYIFLDRFGKPCVVDMDKKLDNKNRILIGPSGSGKSFLLNNYILQSINKMQDVVIIDIGGSYKNLIEVNNGKYYDSADSGTFSFNPFLTPKDKNGNYTYKINDKDDKEATDDILIFITTILTTIWKPKIKEEVDSVENTILSLTVEKYFDYVNENKKFPSLNGYKKFITSEHLELTEEQQKNINLGRFCIMLEPFTDKGANANLLNSETNIDFVNDTLIAFDLETIHGNKDLFPIVIVIVLNLITQKIRQRKGIKKKLIIDEGFDFLQDEKMGLYIASLYRTFRKKEGEVLLAAQSCKFIEACGKIVKDSILGNSDTKIILSHSNSKDSYKDLQRILSITDREIESINSLQKKDTYREFYLKLGKQSAIFRNEVSPVAAVAFDSNQSVFIAVKELFKKYGSTQLAINQYIENRYNKHE